MAHCTALAGSLSEHSTSEFDDVRTRPKAVARSPNIAVGFRVLHCCDFPRAIIAGQDERHKSAARHWRAWVASDLPSCVHYCDVLSQVSDVGRRERKRRALEDRMRILRNRDAVSVGRLRVSRQVSVILLKGGATFTSASSRSRSLHQPQSIRQMPACHGDSMPAKNTPMQHRQAHRQQHR